MAETLADMPWESVSPLKARCTRCSRAGMRSIMGPSKAQRESY
jgi:hypothetical protein